MRVGKFLANLRAASRHGGKASELLQFWAAAGEGVYYFLDQAIWCADLLHSVSHPSSWLAAESRLPTCVHITPAFGALPPC
jgi:hypothetical protein